MRQLRVVGVSGDGRQLLLAPTETGRPTHEVVIDRRLERAVKGLALEEGAEPAVVLTPKDIQARLRAGESIEGVARDAGVPVARVERFAGPVLSEREKVLEGVRAAYMVSRGQLSKAALGEAVDRNLAITPFARVESAGWTAYRRPEGGWIVRLEVTVRGRNRRAEWSYEPAAREVVPLDQYARTLAYLDGSEANTSSPRRRAPVRDAGPTKAKPKKVAAKAAPKAGVTKAAPRKAARSFVVPPKTRARRGTP